MKVVDLTQLVHAQRDKWSCGPHALRHALMTFGKVFDIDVLIKACGANPQEGVNELGLKRAAESFGCVLTAVRFENHHKARRYLRQCLKQRRPVLLCVEQWSHWVVVTNMHHRKYVVVDSHCKRLIRLYTWPQLRKKLGYKSSSKTKVIYDLQPLCDENVSVHLEFRPVKKPKARVTSKALRV